MNEVTTLILTRDDLVRWAKETISFDNIEYRFFKKETTEKILRSKIVIFIDSDLTDYCKYKFLKFNPESFVLPTILENLQTQKETI